MKPVQAKPSKQAPQKTTYRMPAEWEKHEATWLAWPHNPETWPDLPHMENLYGDLIAQITKGEKVRLLVNDAREQDKVRLFLSKKKIDVTKITFLRIPTTDAWIRDYGPNFVLSEGLPKTKIAVNRWIFNAWGSKYEEHQLDNQASKRIIDWLKIMTFDPFIVLEGGSIDSNGKGTILTSEACLLNPNRNPTLNQKKIEGYFKDYLGAKHVIWLGDGVKGDDTDGHVDDIARFVHPATVVCVVETNPKDENYAALIANKKRLQKSVDQDGKKLNVIDLPMPKALFANKKERLPASYANFYIANSCVLVPTFDDKNDKVALKIFENIFPERAVIGINSKILVHGLGGIHCISHEEPAVN